MPYIQACVNFTFRTGRYDLIVSGHGTASPGFYFKNPELGSACIFDCKSVLHRGPFSNDNTGIKRGLRHHDVWLTVLRIRDGLPKMKDFPRELGGSGDTLPE